VVDPPSFVDLDLDPLGGMGGISLSLYLYLFR
jgi:hypothetical protein